MKAAFHTLAAFFALAGFSMGNEMSKPEATGEMLDTLQKIYVISQSTDPEESQQDICEAIDHLKSTGQLATFAVLSHNIAYPQNAGDERFDRLFSFAFWRAVEVISQDRSLEGKACLQDIKQRVSLDGGDKLLFDNFVQKQTDQPGRKAP